MSGKTGVPDIDWGPVLASTKMAGEKQKKRKRRLVVSKGTLEALKRKS